MPGEPPTGLRLRPGDQSLPIPNDGPCVQDAVIEDLANRKLVGVERYGTPLQPHNGRDALRDAYEERSTWPVTCGKL